MGDAGGGGVLVRGRDGRGSDATSIDEYGRREALY